MFTVKIDYSNSKVGGTSSLNSVTLGDFVTRDVFLVPEEFYRLPYSYKGTVYNFETGKDEVRTFDTDIIMYQAEYDFIDGRPTVDKFSNLFAASLEAELDYNLGAGAFFGRQGFVAFNSILPREPNIFDIKDRIFESGDLAYEERSKIEDEVDQFLIDLGDQNIKYIDHIDDTGSLVRFTFSETIAVNDLRYNEEDGWLDLTPYSATNKINSVFGNNDNSLHILGSRFDDALSGGILNDRIEGGQGNDGLGGGWGDDFIAGGQGNDSLFGDLGTDTLVGGSGDDRFSINFDSEASVRDQGITRFSDIIYGGSGEDTLRALDYVTNIDDFRINGTPDAFVLTFVNQYDLTVIGVEYVQFEYFDGDIEEFTLTTAELFAHFAEGTPRPADTGDSSSNGSPGDDSYFGSPAGGRYSGGSGNDNIFIIDGPLIDPSLDGVKVVADDGDDKVSTFGGDDTLCGGTGSDTLSSGAGNDHIYGDAVELRYALPEANQVFRLYQATFNRTPDEGGHKAWTSKLFQGESTLAAVREGFVGSQEFRNKYANVDDATFVKQMYINVLDRDFDQGEVTQGEIDSWTGRISDSFTRADVVNGFAESQQLINNTLQAANKLAVDGNPAAWSDDVYRLYQATLDRAPDIGGFGGWSENLSSGQTLIDVISGFTNSQEFANTYGALSDPEDFVRLLYNNVLERDFDAGEVAQTEVTGWTSQLSETFTRAHIVQGFSQSQEFINNTAADLKDWIRAQGVDDQIDGGSGANVLAGGALADQFVFSQSDSATNTVLDLEAWDYLSFDGFGYGNADEARSHMAQSGGSVVFADQGTEITFERFQLSNVTDDMILV